MLQHFHELQASGPMSVTITETTSSPMLIGRFWIKIENTDGSNHQTLFRYKAESIQEIDELINQIIDAALAFRQPANYDKTGASPEQIAHANEYSYERSTTAVELS